MERKFKEPIRIKWVWIVLGIIILSGVPWYLPIGGIYPIVFGLPYWALISVVSSIALAIFLNYVMSNLWDMESLKEDDKKEGSGN